MQKQILEYYNWEDIKKEICKEMGIDEKHFREYHSIVGGNYKDLWHEWLRFFDGEVTNDKISNVCCDEIIKYKLDWIKREGKEWAEPFIRAVYAVWDKFGGEDCSINIKYSW